MCTLQELSSAPVTAALQDDTVATVDHTFAKNSLNSRSADPADASTTIVTATSDSLVVSPKHPQLAVMLYALSVLRQAGLLCALIVLAKTVLGSPMSEYILQMYAIKLRKGRSVALRLLRTLGSHP